MSEIIINDISKLKPELLTKVLLIQDVLKYLQVKMEVFETFRDKKRQEELFKGGFSKCDGTVKVSKHQDGSAVDFVVRIKDKWTWDITDKRVLANYNIYGAVAKWYGMIWGGDWSWKDYPHIEI